MSEVSIDRTRLGSAHSGHRPWWRQRVSAVLLAPLALWFVVSAGMLDLDSIEAVQAWLAKPLNSAFCGLLVATAALHSAIGVQSVLTDYVDSAGWRSALLIASTGLHGVVVAISLTSLARLLFLGADSAG